MGRIFSGVYTAKAGELRLRHLTRQHVIGEYQLLGQRHAVEARVDKDALRGRCMLAGRNESFLAKFEEKVLHVSIGERKLQFGRKITLGVLPPEAISKAFVPLRARRPLYDAQRQWTILVYMAADNDLERHAMPDLAEMEAALPEQGVELLVLVDRAKKRYATKPDWSDARLYRVRRDADPSSIRSEVLLQPGEIDMGHPAVLGEFIGGALRAFPAPEQHARDVGPRRGLGQPVRG